ncbi:tyrosinase central domain protein [Aspergillus ellipticus CBS 707.79]|uniref:Tyrosinase central domain protein n=1 Tax=Aspergillus ellipticus CBS 707.79 TaxID=1448320 RepID=A0A319DEV9_9EURO|nr:tyrosinase central domain protein [Aspergillus ellipticus CBS 707.79]
MRLGSLLVTALVAFAAPHSGSRCRSEDAAVRRDWGDLSADQRIEFIDALWCLRRTPSTLPHDQFPGVRDRYDDFVATHINYTLSIHSSGLLLPWHRHFTWLFEKALQDECGYTGSIPYWNWPLFTTNLSASPVFDGSNTSLSGDGYLDHSNHKAVPACPRNVACRQGTGGGCIMAGPFQDWPKNMGPVDRKYYQSYGTLPPDVFAYTPGCVKRDFSLAYLQTQNTAAFVDAMLNTTNIVDFLQYMDPSESYLSGAHGSGHRGLGGMMDDPFSSPQDPAFFVHHSMVDRVWTIWQDKDFVNRRDQLNGTTILFDPPGSPVVTLDTAMEWGYLDGPKRVVEVMDSRSGEYCYRYE